VTYLAGGPLAAPAGAAPNRSAAECNPLPGNTFVVAADRTPVNLRAMLKGTSTQSRVQTLRRRTISSLSPFPDEDGSRDPWNGSDLIEHGSVQANGKGFSWDSGDGHDAGRWSLER